MTATKKLSGSTAIVTAAAQGIGEAIARVLAREGASVAVADINLEGVKALAVEIEKSGGSALAIRTDVTKLQEVNDMVKFVLDRWGTVNILVNNAGGYDKFSSILEVSEEEWDQIMALNLKSMFFCSQSVAEDMMKRKKGKIINIASQGGLAPNPFGAPSYIPYGTAKAGVIGFTKHLAKELGAYGITVNAIAPSTAMTPRVKSLRDPKSIEKIASMNPMGRLIEPKDVAEAALFLALEESRNITGVTLNVNAGSLMI